MPERPHHDLIIWSHDFIGMRITPPGAIDRHVVARQVRASDFDKGEEPVKVARRILYIDLDNTLVDFRTRMAGLDPLVLARYEGRMDEAPGIFALMPSMPGALDAYAELSQLFDTYILSTAPWLNPSAWQHKIEWVHEHLGVNQGSPAHKRLILTHHKNLNRGDFLVDDRPNNGAELFEGEWIHFGSEAFPDWATVLPYLRAKA